MYCTKSPSTEFSIFRQKVRHFVQEKNMIIPITLPKKRRSMDIDMNSDGYFRLCERQLWPFPTSFILLNFLKLTKEKHIFVKHVTDYNLYEKLNELLEYKNLKPKLQRSHEHAKIKLYVQNE